MNAKDYWGNSLNVGDAVVFILCHYRALITGKITSIAPKSAQIEYFHPINGGNQVTRRDHWTIIKKPDQPND